MMRFLSVSRRLPAFLLVVAWPLSAAAQQPPRFVFTPTLPGQEAAATAVDGYCPVCIVEKKEWVKGDPRFASVVDGKRYQFPDAKAKAMFDADPTKYVPAAGGDCVVCHVEAGKKMAGSVKHAARYQGRMYLFPGEEQKAMFLADPAKYADADLAYGGNCAVCQVEMNHKMPGKPAHTVVHNGKRYQFPSEKEKNAFLANPDKYAETPRG